MREGEPASTELAIKGGSSVGKHQSWGIERRQGEMFVSSDDHSAGGDRGAD